MSTQFTVGASIILKDLVAAAEKNGSRGTLDRYNEETQRWKVTLQSGEDVNAKEANLTLDLDLETAKRDASYKPPIKAPATTKLGSYYGTDPDNYAKARVVREGEIKSTKFDHVLYVAISKCLTDGGKVTLADFESKIWKEIADGRLGKSELTCNERWTVRYGLGEFDWQFEARFKLLHDMRKIDVMDLNDKKVTDEKELDDIFHGPSLAELMEPPAKKRKGANTELIWVDGMYLDQGMLKVVREVTGDDRVVDCYEAVALFNAAADGNELSCCERWTLRFILSAYVFTDAAFMFIKEALAERPGKLKYTDSLGA